MNKKMIKIKSNFHNNGTRKIFIPNNMTLQGYITELSYVVSCDKYNDLFNSHKKRLKHLKNLFCNSNSDCQCWIVEA